jgi:GT2 family glycosyltransferase
MSSSLIVSIYKLEAELPLLLNALAKQSHIPDEIIFAEDAISEDTIKVLSTESKKYPQLSLRLVQHEDRGFRKAEIVNKAVTLAVHDQLIFLDGDCLPHPHYVRSYVENLGPGKLLNARPVYLRAEYRKNFSNSEHQFILPTTAGMVLGAIHGGRYAFYVPWMPVRQRNSAMRGSSWACLKEDFIKVNGFDEQFCDLGYGYEDIDMSHRLNRSGVQCFVPKNRVIYYHFGAAGVGESKALALVNTKAYLELNDQRKLIACEKGINQWLGIIDYSWTSDL